MRRCLGVALALIICCCLFESKASASGVKHRHSVQIEQHASEVSKGPSRMGKWFRSGCDASDASLILQKKIICASLGGCPAGNITAHEDWPNQVIYYKILLRLLVDKGTCLNTTIAKNIVSWLQETDTARSSWWNTWVVFQAQYYDMPRAPGERIESPATLGRKCWAFAYLAQGWDALRAELHRTMEAAGLSLEKMISAYDNAIPFTLDLCNKVAANCFVNASYSPALRNGTCANATSQFFVGFEWENGNNNVQERDDAVVFPFPHYGRTASYEKSLVFAINTALNFII